MRILSLSIFLITISNSFSQKISQVFPDYRDLVEKNRSVLIKYKKSNNISGLSFALFTKDSIIWQESIGHTTYGKPVTKNTLFSIQSISKNYTALAVMIAVQEELLNLDDPISFYLPNFKVNSCFENNPEQKITLKMLLTHTSGLTHEAPVGNNYDYTPCSIADHLNSIKETWLKYPAGLDYSYSNLGFDLLAEIIEVKSGMKLNDYLKAKLFIPLEMESTTLDNQEFQKITDRTEGNISATKPKHYQIPLLGSGAVYTNLSDFIKYVQFQMNLGVVNSTTLLEKKYLTELYRIRLNNYGLGTYIDIIDSILFINHNGSGYGYSSTFLWYPEYMIGSVILCNKQVDTYSISEDILKNIIRSSSYRKSNLISDELKAMNKQYFNNPAIYNNISVPNCTADTVFKSEWKKYLGKYSMDFSGMDFKWYAKLAFALGFKPQKVLIFKENSTLKIKDPTGVSILREFKPGFFFTKRNEVLDFNTLRYKNIKLK